MRGKGFWATLGCSVLLALPALGAPNDPPSPHAGGFHGGEIHVGSPHPGGFHVGAPDASGVHGGGIHAGIPYEGGFHAGAPIPSREFSGSASPPGASLPGGLGTSAPIPGGRHFAGVPAERLVHPAPPTDRRAVDVSRWHSGHWWHGQHEGRIGWWWIVGPDFFWYPSVTALYPEPTEGYWYWCDAYQQYYPDVTDCPSGWRAVVPP
jgi:hypothetical protein